MRQGALLNHCLHAGANTYTDSCTVILYADACCLNIIGLSCCSSESAAVIACYCQGLNQLQPAAQSLPVHAQIAFACCNPRSTQSSKFPIRSISTHNIQRAHTHHTMSADIKAAAPETRALLEELPGKLVLELMDARDAVAAGDGGGSFAQQQGAQQVAKRQRVA